MTLPRFHLDFPSSVPSAIPIFLDTTVLSRSHESVSNMLSTFRDFSRPDINPVFFATRVQRVRKYSGAFNIVYPRNSPKKK